MPLVPILAVALLGPPAADPVAGSPASLPSHQVFTWTWTDGSKATERTFAESEYHTPAKIPKFEVTVRPAEPRWTARLLGQRRVGAPTDEEVRHAGAYALCLPSYWA